MSAIVLGLRTADDVISWKVLGTVRKLLACAACLVFWQQGTTRKSVCAKAAHIAPVFLSLYQPRVMRRRGSARAHSQSHKYIRWTLSLRDVRGPLYSQEVAKSSCECGTKDCPAFSRNFKSTFYVIDFRAFPQLRKTWQYSGHIRLVEIFKL